jgi:hypothetical protein
VFAAAEDLSLMDIPCSQISPSSLAPVFMLDTHGLAWSSGGDAVLAAARLDAGFLVGADDVVLRSQRLALPDPLVEIEDTARLIGEVGIPWEDPAAMVPWANGVLGEPAPDGCLPNGGHEPAADHFTLDLGHAEAGKGKPDFAREFTRESLYGDDDTGGERHPADPAVGALRVRPNPARKSACATC